eukprot:Gb_06382 [translate_table: standard]
MSPLKSNASPSHSRSASFER